MADANLDETTHTDRLREAVLNVMPNRCCKDWRTCPYDQHDGAQIVEALMPLLATAWTEGYDRAMQDAHVAHSRYGYVERLGESDDWNPYHQESAASSTCRFAPLREHTPSECPLCNPTGWMGTPGGGEHA